MTILSLIAQSAVQSDNLSLYIAVSILGAVALLAWAAKVSVRAARAA